MIARTRTTLIALTLTAATATVLAAGPSADAQTAPNAERRTFTDHRHKPQPHHVVFGYPGEKQVFFRGKLPVDADGSPHCYHVGMTCSDGLDDWEHTVVDCARVHGSLCEKTKGFKSEPHWGQPGTVVQCKLEGGRCVDGDTTQVTCHMTAHANDGLDNLANGGRPGNLYGVVKDHNGKLCTIKDDENGGHYVSGTALTRNGATGSRLHACDPGNYVDSETINYIALPKGATELGIHLGDIVAVANWDNMRIAYAIFADIGGKEGALGEGSISLATALGTPTDPKGHHTKPGEKMPKDGLAFVVFPGSHHQVQWPLVQSQINAEGAKLLTAWGGFNKFRNATASLGLDPQ